MSITSTYMPRHAADVRPEYLDAVEREQALAWLRGVVAAPVPARHRATRFVHIQPGREWMIPVGALQIDDGYYTDADTAYLVAHGVAA